MRNTILLAALLAFGVLTVSAQVFIGVVVPLTPVPDPEVGEFIVDNGDFYTIETGSFTNSNVSPFFGSRSRLGNAAGDTQITYYPTSDLDCNRTEVYARWTEFSSRATNARYTVHHAAGTTEVFVDQTINGFQWNLLGTWDMGCTLGGEFTFMHRVIADHNASGTLNIDGMRFVAISTIIPNPATPAAGPGYTRIPFTGDIETGPCPSGGCKHVRTAYRTVDQKQYFSGGDQIDSFEARMHSLDLATGTFALIQPECRTDEGLQNQQLDEHMWAYDTSRDIFWYIHSGAGQAVAIPCPGDVADTAISFDISGGGEGEWTSRATEYAVWDAGIGGGQNHRNWMYYDPVNDDLISFSSGGGTPIFTVRYYGISPPSFSDDSFPGVNVTNANVTLDLTNRKIWGIADTGGKMFSYHIDTQVVEYFGAPRCAENPSVPGIEQGVWLRCRNGPLYRPTTNTLLYFAWADCMTSAGDDCAGFGTPDLRIHRYNITAGTWELDIAYTVPGDSERLVANQVGYDPGEDKFFMYGSVHSGGGAGFSSQPYIFVYEDVAP